MDRFQSFPIRFGKAISPTPAPRNTYPQHNLAHAGRRVSLSDYPQSYDSIARAFSPSRSIYHHDIMCMDNTCMVINLPIAMMAFALRMPSWVLDLTDHISVSYNTSTPGTSSEIISRACLNNIHIWWTFIYICRFDPDRKC